MFSDQMSKWKYDILRATPNYPYVISQSPHEVDDDDEGDNNYGLQTNPTWEYGSRMGSRSV